MVFVFPALIFLGILCDHAPGTVQVDANLFFDKYEISNYNYYEYISWLRKVFGEDSPLWKNALPGTSQIDSLSATKKIIPSSIFLNPDYLAYPVVNVSFEQATNYCQWRSDRVYEKTLVELRIIKYNPDQNASNFFTIKKYTDTIPGDISFVGYAIYRLPTPEEWDRIAQHKLTDKKFQPEYQRIKYKSANKIFSMYGSVAEMTSTRGLGKGGSFKDSIPESKDMNYNKPEEWLGFRCVCELALDHKNSFYFHKVPTDRNYRIPIRAAIIDF